jgi:hypothetical protein
MKLGIGSVPSSIDDKGIEALMEGDDEIVEVVYVDDAAALQALSEGSNGDGEGGGPTLGGQSLEDVIAEWERNKGAAAEAEAKSQAAAEAELDALAAAMFAEEDESGGDHATAKTTSATAQSSLDRASTADAPKRSVRRSSQQVPAAAAPPPAAGLFSAGWSVGIDLGTTNSAVAAMVNGKPTVFQLGGSYWYPLVELACLFIWSFMCCQSDFVFSMRNLYPKYTLSAVLALSRFLK